MAEQEYKHWCGNCQIRIYIQRHEGYILTWQNCPYTCEYATAMRCLAEGKGNTMDDSISRRVAIEEINGEKFDEGYCTEYENGYNDGIDFAVDKLTVLPPVQSERQKGNMAADRIGKMKTFNIIVSYNGDVNTWDEIKIDAENEKIRNVFIGKKEFVNVVMCKDCRHANECHKSVQYTRNESNSVTIGYSSIKWCSRGERSDE